MKCWNGVTISGHFCYCKRCELEDANLPEWDGIHRGAKMGRSSKEEE